LSDGRLSDEVDGSREQPNSCFPDGEIQVFSRS
jgi:hypothetical protein